MRVRDRKLQGTRAYDIQVLRTTYYSVLPGGRGSAAPRLRFALDNWSIATMQRNDGSVFCWRQSPGGGGHVRRRTGRSFYFHHTPGYKYGVGTKYLYRVRST